LTAAVAVGTPDPAIETVQIADLKLDPDLQCRARGTQPDVVRQYSDDMKRGDIFPPIVVFRDAKNTWVANGFHRVAAATLAGFSELQAEIKSGSKRDALLFAVQADRAIGLRRTTQDKRRSIELLIAAYPKMSDRKVGEACGVDNKTVAATRARMLPNEEIPHPEMPPGGVINSPGQVSKSPSPDRFIVQFQKIWTAIPDENRSQFADRVLAILSETRA
jgi:ParB-like chromosome segregation protein Spo0J